MGNVGDNMRWCPVGVGSVWSDVMSYGDGLMAVEDEGNRVLDWGLQNLSKNQKK